MLNILRGMFDGGERPENSDAPKPLSPAELDVMRQRFDNERAQQDLTAAEVWVRIGDGLSQEDRAKVEAMRPRPPFVHHYHPDSAGPAYISEELELLAKDIARRDLSGPPYILSSDSLDRLGKYIEARSGARRVARIAGDRRWEWPQALGGKHPNHNWSEIMAAVRNLGRRIFDNDSKEFELSAEFREKGDNAPDSFLITTISAITEGDGQKLRTQRQARKVPHPDWSAEKPF